TNGYQRKAQAVLGTATPYNPNLGSQSSAGSIATADQPKAVILNTRAYGQDGGNDVTGQILDPAGAAKQALSVSVAGKAIAVKPATDATGAITSTAAQVVTAINASQAASDLVFAERYTGSSTNAGAGIVSAGAVTQASDFLKAPADYPRGPQTVKML